MGYIEIVRVVAYKENLGTREFNPYTGLMVPRLDLKRYLLWSQSEDAQ